MTCSRLCALPSRAWQFSLASALLLMVPASCQAAQTGPFGAGLPDGGVPGATYFPRIASAFISMQVYFNQHMTTAVRAIRHDGTAVWTLLALSFLYGIVHAAGPGHGKAVVSSYLLATRQTLRNGIVLAFVASLAQAGGAIALVLVASMILHMTSVSMTLAAFRFEIGSDMLIVLLGCWLVWTKIIRPARSRRTGFEPVNALMQPTLHPAAAASGAPSRLQALDTGELAVSTAGSHASAQA